MSKVYVTRKIPEVGIKMLQDAGHEVDVSAKDGVLTKEELTTELKKKEYDAVLCLLTDQINGEIFDAAPSAKIFANYAVGYNNIDIKEAKKRGVTITNTPGVLTNTVAEHTMALMLSITRRVTEGDKFTREGKYKGWAPELLLGTDLKGKTLGVLGAGRIGYRVGYHAHKGFDMNIIYYDIKQNEHFEKDLSAKFYDTPEAVLKEADVVTIHVPLLPSTRHLINKERLAMMKKGAYLINSSRGPVVDEFALVDALKSGKIKGASIDVFEKEPELAPGLAELPNVVITPHIASATEDTRGKMSEIAAQNILDFLAGGIPENIIK
ncbi:MAG TPA: D-glycerate dehydrogenase [Candidatus Paceibacterota bacterium]|jgi:glyoxylate reductase|nr:D-glycerate dehydrogenase [Parcubacteria group bacterium]HJN63022.1 D-glycerate dehydrogenase [Candidatus Paceibacterota bacterium]|tara:strand:+ start:9715 stop:10683 length:969 start_codon:yes stop_codon:yes gene_type:complete